ncbi:hypothetical protein ACFYS8_05690 [Kitasatospora sp. NPDC004615]|uniref:hypothetical protein n=1 Tax=unclassified Kitasatospora TaxID=2633591 RepID=UPI003688BE5D
MTSDLLESQDRTTFEIFGTRPAVAGRVFTRPALLAGEDRDAPDHHIFRGTD